MSAPERDRLRPHIADGIKEYDNPLPTWWVGLFYGTIIFSIAYMAAYYVVGGPTLVDEYRAEPVVAAAAGGDKQGPLDLGTILHDSASIAEGKAAFLQNCMACHGELGQGNIGPNLTDDYWLHGGTPESILKTVQNGVPDKGMPAWQQVVGDKKTMQLVAFITSIRGSKPANPKAPQGTLEK